VKESEIQARIRLALGEEHDLTLWRNNVGVAEMWSSAGKSQRVSYGLCVGSSDLIGLLSPAGRFVALEVKRPGEKPTQEQVKFMQHVRQMGGFAAVVCSADEARAAVQRARQGASE